MHRESAVGLATGADEGVETEVLVGAAVGAEVGSRVGIKVGVGGVMIETDELGLKTNMAKKTKPATKVRKARVVSFIEKKNLHK